MNQAHQREPTAIASDSKAPSLKDWINIVTTNSRCSVESAVIAMVLLDRLTRVDRMNLDSGVIHRYYLCAVMLSAKMHDEQYGDNLWYAKVGSLNISELNSLEVEICDRLNWRLGVSRASFVTALNVLFSDSLPRRKANRDSSASLSDGSQIKPDSIETWTSKAHGHHVYSIVYSCASSFFTPEVGLADSLVAQFLSWARRYDPDDDEEMEYWINVLFDIGCSEATAWTILHWALVLCHDDTFTEERYELQSVWADVVKKTPAWSEGGEPSEVKGKMVTIGSYRKRRNSNANECVHLVTEIRQLLTEASLVRVKVTTPKKRFEEVLREELSTLVEDAENYLLPDDDVDDVVLKARILIDLKAALPRNGSHQCVTSLKDLLIGDSEDFLLSTIRHNASELRLPDWQ